MSKKRKSLTKEEIDVIAQYQWANITDIMNIGAIGRNKARNVFNVISDNGDTVTGASSLSLIFVCYNMALSLCVIREK